MKKVTAIVLLATLLVLNLNGVVFAAEGNTQIVTPRWENTCTLTGILATDGSEGSLSIFLDAYPYVTNITATATLYYKNPSNVWVRIPMGWEYSVNDNVLGIAEKFTAAIGTVYKVVFEAQVYGNGYTETITREFFNY